MAEPTRMENLLDYVVPVVDVSKFNLAVKQALDEQDDTIVENSGCQLVNSSDSDSAPVKAYRVTIQLDSAEMARVKDRIDQLSLSAGTIYEEYSSRDLDGRDEDKLLTRSGKKRRVVPD